MCCMLRTRPLAIKHSARSFFNSYFRDMGTSYDEAHKSFSIILEDVTITVPVTFHSKVGTHRYGENFILKTLRGERSIGFLEAAELISYANGGEDTKLYQRLNNSVRNMALSLDLREKEIEKLFETELDFLSAEQGLFIGHNFHPTPKSKDEFSEKDVLTYSPEFGRSFKMCWIYVHQSIFFEERSKTFGQINWQKLLLKKDLPQGYVAYPLHPWQKKVLFQQNEIKNYLEKGLILDGTQSLENWFATSSMRSLYSPDSPFMVKFSMSVKLTNSIRHLQKNEVSRGMLVHDLFSSPPGLEFSRKFPQFKVMQEPLYIGIKDAAGNVLPETIVLLRENPFRKESSKSVAVLATLTQDHPKLQMNLITRLIEGTKLDQLWFKNFLDHVITPLIVAQADYGILLGAHQQNLVLILKNGLPAGAYFRDCQGTGLSELGSTIFKPHLSHAKNFEENILPKDAGVALFTYYLVINSVFSTIGSIANASSELEEKLLEMFRLELKALSYKVKDPSVVEHLLHSKELVQKGNFRCSVKNINENTTTDPLSIYNKIPNPIMSELL